ncbi:MAG TPA: hypothetical protein VGJ95_22210 [Pseudonocardiaceae bacterium]|jgi:hypothetical protein
MTSVSHRPAGPLLGGSGALVLVAGTFLPWLASGAALRNSYQAMAVARRLTPLGDGATGAALLAWPALGGITASLLVLYVLGLRRTAAVGISLLATLAATVAAAMVVLLPPGDFTVRAVLLGPVVTATGAALAVAGAVTTLVRPTNRASRRAGGAQ